MRVILTERVASLGSVGEIVNVSPGYGRNFLIPRGFAVVADEANKRQQDHLQKRLSKKIEAEKNAALELKKKVEAVTLEVTKKVGGSGKLFGTVTTQELSNLLAEKGLEVPRRLIVASTPVKTLGDYEVSAKLFGDVEATFKLKVVMDPAQVKEEAEKAARKAKAAKEAKEAPKAEAAEGEAEETEEELENEEA